jgi:hypothetical protein
LTPDQQSADLILDRNSNEGRDLAAAALGAAEDVVKGTAAEADKNVDTDKAKGYVASTVDSARGLAAQALHTAQGLVASAQEQTDEAKPAALFNDVNGPDSTVI